LNSFASDCNRTFSVGVLNLNNMRDEASDRKVKNTLVVKIGGKKAKLYHYFLVTFAMALMVVFCDN
jgi:1,4-dihydroxy-2-naphthoate octaprenyltransferase